MARAHALAAAGAAIIDVGGESAVGRPPAGRRWRRRSRASCRSWSGSPPSSTSSSPSTRTSRPWRRPPWPPARRWSTTSPARRDPGIAAVCARTGAGLVIMHTRVPPKGTLLDPDAYGDVVADVREFLADAHGAPRWRRGWGRSRSCSTRGRTSPRRPPRPSPCCAASTSCTRSGRPLLLAVSRKDFLGADHRPRAARARGGDARRRRLGGGRRRAPRPRPRRRPRPPTTSRCGPCCAASGCSRPARG